MSAENPTPAGLIGHYIGCLHTASCARKDFEVARKEAGSGTPTDNAAHAMDEAIINVAKLISALALGEMPRRTQVTS